MLTLSSENIQIEVAPEIGGRITTFTDRRTGYQFLWKNPNLELRKEQPGAQYDPNFYGGIDELMPNDMPETIDEVECPDHGELWTASFEHKVLSTHSVAMWTTLPKFQFEIVKVIEVIDYSCRVLTRVTNHSQTAKPFLWKLHAAVAIQPGDAIDCSAERYTAADPDWSRRKDEGKWEGEVVPEFDGTAEFLYLHGLWNGYMSWERGGKKFDVRFDTAVFPYAWYFASYGGFDGHHVAILEPCTCMPISVNEAALLGQCPILQPGQTIETTYSYRGIDED
jgi:hypothetical protein